MHTANLTCLKYLSIIYLLQLLSGQGLTTARVVPAVRSLPWRYVRPTGEVGAVPESGPPDKGQQHEQLCGVKLQAPEGCGDAANTGVQCSPPDRVHRRPVRPAYLPPAA